MPRYFNKMELKGQLEALVTPLIEFCAKNELPFVCAAQLAISKDGVDISVSGSNGDSASNTPWNASPRIDAAIACLDDEEKDPIVLALLRQCYGRNENSMNKLYPGQ